jgi:hypothetical protein
MLDNIFSITALIGGTVLGFQFVLLLFGVGGDDGPDGAGHGSDLGGADGHDFAGHHGDVGGTDVFHADSAGHGHGHDVSHWFYELISLRTLSAAFAFFGIAGKTALANGWSNPQAFGVATLAGFAAMYLVYWLFKQIFRLQHAGNENIRNALGAAAAVYVPIPGKRAGVGKVTFVLQNRSVEYQAVTDDDERLKTGEKVLVVGIVNSDTVRVSRVPSTVEV